MMKTKYHVLWIDDEWESMKSFETHCRLQYGLELHPFKTQKAGLADYELHKDFYEAVILDAKGLDESEHEVANVASLQKAVMYIKEHFPDFSYFIFTGQEDLMSQDVFRSFFPDYYKKVRDDDKLCEDIVNAIENKQNRRIINKHTEIFSFLQPPLYEETIDIIKFHECGMNNNPDVFNKIRKALDWVMNYLYEIGILLEPYKKTNLAECSQFLANKELQDIVYLHVQRSFHTLTSICNEGSHRLAVDELVKTGKAPYLVSSTVIEFLNILYWLTDLPKPESQEDLESIRNNIRSKINTNEPEQIKTSIDYSAYEGKDFVVEQDKQNNYHCGECCLSFKAAQYFLGKTVTLHNITPNTAKSKEIYPFFAQFEEIK